MNPHSGHVIVMEPNQPFPSSYEPVPQELQPAARKKLAGKSEAYVSPSSGGKLSKWAREKRKREMAKESKRRNR